LNLSEGAHLLCRSADLVDSGAGVRFTVIGDGREEPAFAIRFEGAAHAYLNRCAHARSQLDWNPGCFFDREGLLLVCSLHGALYAPDTGECVGGPCVNGALLPLGIEERDGSVFLTNVAIAAVSQ
jgi:nitrite reductase/ring-hydroxylating ferredoxin subunit